SFAAMLGAGAVGTGGAAGAFTALRTDAAAANTAVAVPIDSQEFAEAFARQTTRLVIQGHDRAEIQVTPEDLGPIRIEIRLDGDSADLGFSAAHASTRAAIEAALPALRQLLADQGMRLNDWRLDGQAGADRGFGGQDASLTQQFANQSGHSGWNQSGQSAAGNTAGTAAELARQQARIAAPDRPTAAAGGPDGLRAARGDGSGRKIDLLA
ncbi:MAG: flagellar hook-length control protein FliK, partial [Lautropia sp.]